MATYSNDATTSIVLSSVKNIRADGNNSLFTVGANEEYELIKYFQIDQDGSASVMFQVQGAKKVSMRE